MKESLSMSSCNTTEAPRSSFLEAEPSGVPRVFAVARHAARWRSAVASAPSVSRSSFDARCMSMSDLPCDRPTSPPPYPTPAARFTYPRPRPPRPRPPFAPPPRLGSAGRKNPGPRLGPGGFLRFAPPLAPPLAPPPLAPPPPLAAFSTAFPNERSSFAISSSSCEMCGARWGQLMGCHDLFLA